ncbi:MAG: hypothetical protein WCJ46_02975 [bacterium]
MLRLHDIQVMINSAAAVDKLQSVTQHQSQIAQTNMASQLNSETEIKKNQIQSAENGNESEAVSENGQQTSHKRKDRHSVEQRGKKNTLGEPAVDIKTQGHKLDITV